MKVENMWKRISSMPDSRSKAVKVVQFAFKQPPHCFWWTEAMYEFQRLVKLGYWKWQDESRQNG